MKLDQGAAVFSAALGLICLGVGLGLQLFVRDSTTSAYTLIASICLGFLLGYVALAIGQDVRPRAPVVILGAVVGFVDVLGFIWIPIALAMLGCHARGSFFCPQ